MPLPRSWVRDGLRIQIEDRCSHWKLMRKYTLFGSRCTCMSLCPCVSLWVYLVLLFGVGVVPTGTFWCTFRRLIQLSIMFPKRMFSPLEAKPSECCFRKDSGTELTSKLDVFKRRSFIFLKKQMFSFSVHRKSAWAMWSTITSSCCRTIERSSWISFWLLDSWLWSFRSSSIWLMNTRICPVGRLVHHVFMPFAVELNDTGPGP